MEIKYNRTVAIAFFILALLNVVLGGWLLLLGTFHFALILGILFVWIAVLYMRRPYFIVEERRIVTPALIGPIRREFAFGGPDSMKVEGGSVYVQKDGQWKRLPVRRWMSDATDWKALEDRFPRA
jgi:hypothetical protein